MMPESPQILVLLEALGIGLLIGIERERNTTATDATATVGVRTFALASLIGALSQIAGGWPLVAVTLGAVGWLRAQSLAQLASQPGLTTSLALLLTVVLGALTVDYTFLAAATGVVVTTLLAARAVLHKFSRSVLTDVELRDGLILGVAALVILPILPDTGYGPGNSLNPQKLFILVLLVLAIGATSHICTRVFGARLGLPLSGFLSGFVSSTATVAAMARKSQDQPEAALSAAAGATLSSVSSLVQIGVILLLASPSLLVASAPMLILSAVVAGLYGCVFVFLGLRRNDEKDAVELSSRIFSIWRAVAFALTVTAVVLASTVLGEHFGEELALISIALAGAVNTGTAAIALASLVDVDQLPQKQAVLALAIALTLNTVIRIVLAVQRGGVRFSGIASFGLFLTGLAVWGGWWFLSMQA